MRNKRQRATWALWLRVAHGYEDFAGWEEAAASGGTSLVTVSVNGAARAADLGYFASKDATDSSLWLTINGTVTGAASIRIE